MRSRTRELLINAGLVVGSILFSWAAIELIVWQVFPEKRDKILSNMISADRRGTLTEGFFRNFYTYDPTYGWLPIANFEGRKWGHQITMLADGVRANGPARPPAESPLVLAIGDSYTFGDEVADDETWPAIFERDYGARTLNAGVSSFGFDQMVMRAEELGDAYKPDVIAVTLIAGSHERAGYAVRHGAYKPYFDVVDGALVTHNIPVPRQDPVDRLRYFLGHSYVLHFPMHRFAPKWWWRGAMWDFRKAGNDPVAVSCHLAQRLRNFAASRKMGLAFFFLVEDDTDRSFPDFRKFHACVKALEGDQVVVADTQAFYTDLYQQEPGRRAELRNPPPGSHFTPAGNALVAKLEAAALLPLLHSVPARPPAAAASK